jgi:hypothetical protein
MWGGYSCGKCWEKNCNCDNNDSSFMARKRDDMGSITMDTETDAERKLKIAIEALETLAVAVNDKQPDPGATLFIKNTLRKLK